MTRRGSLVGMLVVLAFFAMSVTAVLAAEKSTSKPKKVEKVTGMVVAAAKDKTGIVTAVAIKSEQGEYAVSSKGKGKELLKLVDKRVEVSGTVREGKGKKTITVTEFKEAAK